MPVTNVTDKFVAVTSLSYLHKKGRSTMDVRICYQKIVEITENNCVKYFTG